MVKKKKYRGHYCWCCGCIRPNEKFSGKGHSRHLCKDCQKLGKEELSFRQHQRNIDRLLDFDGRIRRKTRHVFERYLSHKDARVREYAEKVKAHNEQLRREIREMYQAEREAEAQMLAEYEELANCDDPDDDDHEPLNDAELEEIPF
jgi:single-stranded DNA-specific DHH superfamily exonuclease